MKAVAYHGAGQALTLQDIDVPRPGPGQLLLKVHACGICGSDLHAYQAGAEHVGICDLDEQRLQRAARPMLEQLIAMAPRASHIVSVGASMEADSIAPHVAAAKKVRLTFSFGYEREDFEFILRMIEGGRMDTEHLITRRVSLDATPEAFAELLAPNSHCKVMIGPQAAA